MLLNKFFGNIVLRQIQHIKIERSVQLLAALRSKTDKTDDCDKEKFHKYLDSLRQEFYDLRAIATGNTALVSRMKQLDGIVTSYEQQRAIQSNMVTKADIENEKDDDMRELMKEENEVYSDLLLKTEQEIRKQLLTLADNDYYPSLIFEVTAGAGGQEAMLFAEELLDMYCKYFDYNGWHYEIIDKDFTDIGGIFSDIFVIFERTYYEYKKIFQLGIRHANLHIHDPEAFNNLRYEAGVHRVQRVPATEKAGRIHTSTVSVTVIPKPSNVNINISEKDLKIETKRASGAGGQHVNTTDSAVRVVHLPTGIAVECQTDRSQIKNREIAIKRLQAKLLQQQLESAEANAKATKRAQQGHLNRNEKIRTYNFVQDRITDHRIQKGTVHNLEEFLKGGAHLESLIQKVATDFREAKLADMIDHWHNLSAKDEKKSNKQ